MKKKNYKGKCEKISISKCKDVCRTYNKIQYVYANILQNDNNIKEIKCNVPLENIYEEEYTSDFVCITVNNDIIVRECVFKKYLLKPMTVKLLDISKEYWENHGVKDWGIVIDE